MTAENHLSEPPLGSHRDARKPLGERIRMLWKESGESQDDFVRALGISTVTLSNYMNGKRTPDSEFLFALKKKLNVCIDWLLTGEGSMHPGKELAQAQQPAAPTQPVSSCARCERLEEKLDRIERQRDELVMENRQLLLENGDLKANYARLEERQKNLEPTHFLRKKRPESSSDGPFDGKSLS